MIFFYTGIGFAMLTTVVAIFQTSVSINKNQFLNIENTIEPNKAIIQKQNDKKFLQMLNDIKGVSLGSGLEICQNIKTGFIDELNPNYQIFSKYSILNTYKAGIPSYATHPRLKDGCDLIADKHRVVIVASPKEENTYNLYSCIIDIEPKCSFELIN